MRSINFIYADTCHKVILMKVLFFTLLLFISSQVFAQDREGELNTSIDRVILNFSFDEEDNFHPDIYLPFSWNEDLSAAFSFRTTADYENEKVLNIVNSNKNTEINYNFINIYPVLWKSDNNVFGLDIGIIDIDKEQAGFFTDTGGTFNFTNDLTIQVIKPSFFYRFNRLQDKDNGVLYGLSVSPFSSLSVTQSTVFSGALNQSGSADGDTESSLSLRFELDGRYQFSSGYQSYYGFQYEYLPMEYTLAVLDGSGLFTTQSFDVVEHIFKASYKIKLKTELFSGLKPVIGVSYEKTNGEDSNSGDDYSYDRFLIVFGIEG